MPSPSFEPFAVDEDVPPAGSWLESGCSLEMDLLQRIKRGYLPGRSPDVIVVPRVPHSFGGFVMTGHSGPWDYLQDVPLVFYGPGYIRRAGVVQPDREVTLADLAPTLAELLGTSISGAEGQVIDEVLVPAEERPVPPRLVAVVVWDGGGTNVLETWPGSVPVLDELTAEGAAVDGAIVGSSPSVTPSIHTTIGTGTFPRKHGIISIPIRVDGRVFDSFTGKSATYMEVPTLADSYDVEQGNAPEVGLVAYKSWHLGLLGHGAEHPAGDKDVAVFVDTQEQLETNPEIYELPSGLKGRKGLDRATREIDLQDGKLDDTWMGNEVLDSARYRRDTPVWVLQQTALIKRLFERKGFGADEVPDLFFTNYKQLDEAGHNWNMLSQEVREVLEYTDAALDDLRDYFDRKVGRGKWVMAVTADHGQTPDPVTARGWPIRMGTLESDMEAAFEVPVDELFDGTSSAGMWVDQAAADAAGLSLEDISDFFLDYTIGDNVTEDVGVPDVFKDKLDVPLFQAAFPAPEIGRIARCIKSRS